MLRVTCRSTRPPGHPPDGVAARLASRPVQAPRLAADAEALDERLVARLVALLDVVEKAAAGRYHLQQPTTRVVVLVVGLEVLGKVGDAFREDRDLDLGRTRIVLAGGVFLDERSLALRRNRHRAFLSRRG